MKSLSLSLCVLVSVTLIDALKFPVRQLKSRSDSRKRSGHVAFSHATIAAASSPDDIDLNTVHDLIYLANSRAIILRPRISSVLYPRRSFSWLVASGTRLTVISYPLQITLGGADYPVQLDTGSSDLWVKGPTSPLPNSNQTSITYNLTYGIGWAYGTVAYTATQFAGISIPSQAYLDVSHASNPALSYGADGIVGLGFTSLSTIDALVNHTGGSTGRSLLYNAFASDTSEPNYIAFSLQRSTDPDSDVEGSFSIGEVEPQYAAVLNSTALSTWPVSSPSRWNVLVDAVLVGSKTVAVSSSVDGVPSGKAVALLDSGTSYSYASEDVCTAIYGSVQGASYSADIGQWIVPCDAEIDMALQFGGKVYPIHPLDVSPASVSDPNTCVGSFIPQAVAVGAGQL
ncbi:hypothetical protein NM688_g8411 [Phlebia brevispora]|uniref:Uncharacterized protein n=1 Tax=Phlebia brevispora TaxID=194682 RepID=A0ACC1RTK6_9APHY|nr:hypothetical protein NM688_g8411 [Phlebia brevispora]